MSFAIRVLEVLRQKVNPETTTYQGNTVTMQYRDGTVAIHDFRTLTPGFTATEKATWSSDLVSAGNGSSEERHRVFALEMAARRNEGSVNQAELDRIAGDAYRNGVNNAIQHQKKWRTA
jgi:hypothetical protein